MCEIDLKSHAGLGDALFITPSLRRIKEAYPTSRISIHTSWPAVFEANPFVDQITDKQRGLHLKYVDPATTTREPTLKPPCHHIIADWNLICTAYGLSTKEPELKPETYFPFRKCGGMGSIGVQVIHKKQDWHPKKTWDGFEALSRRPGFKPIPHLPGVKELASWLTSCKSVVCAETGISHLCRALDVPCTVVYGGFADPAWNGYREQNNITTSIPCGPCYSGDPCPMSPPKECLRVITVDAVERSALWFAETRRQS
jgi:hypothetical protein